MNQYFAKNPEIISQKTDISYQILDKEIHLKSDNGVFSKKKIDIGSDYFLKEIVSLPLKGKILDYGAGIGVIGITLNLFYKDLDVTYCEINDRARELVKENLKINDLDGVVIDDKQITSIKANSFDYIFLNPPIRSGKKNMYEMYQIAHQLLKDNKEFYIVIRKDKGMASHKAFLETIFKKTEIFSRDKGYYILKMVK